MVSVEYTLETGVGVPWEFLAVMGAIGVVGLVVFILCKFILDSDNGSTVGLGVIAVSAVIIVSSVMGSTYTDIPDGEPQKVAAELSEKTCIDVTETDALLMLKGKSRSVPYEYDKMTHKNKNYIVMEGKC